MPEDWEQGGFGFYVHWPFCESKCPYCDFNSHVREKIDQKHWLSAYLTEIDRYASLVPNRVLNSVFFGGGTPSLMEPETVAAILDQIKQTWPQANDLEVTLEANPGSVEADKFSAFAQAGVSRVSLGIQALDDADLKRLGRLHSVDDAKEAFQVAKNHFSRVSFDLIYARQDQSLKNWRTELSEALEMAVDHLSLYQLTIEPGTAFGHRHANGGLNGLPNEDLAADMYEVTQELCEKAGYDAYEVSNHAKPGSESRHNLIYWRYGDYIGVGPGAHGRLTLGEKKFATTCWSNPERWLREVDRSMGENMRTKISRDEQAIEYLMMGLRLREGIDLRRFEQLSSSILNNDAKDELRELGLLQEDGFRLWATLAGRPVLNAVIRKLMSD